MKVQNTGVVSKSERVLQFVKRIVLSWPGKVMLAVVGVGSLMSIPLATVAEDDHGVPSGLALGFGKDAADRGPDAENSKEVCVGHERENGLGPAASAKAKSAGPVY